MSHKMIGERFGRLVVTGGAPSGRVTCQCDCGTICEKLPSNLRGGKTKSCGCIRKERNNHTTHGGTGTLTHKRWRTMRRRCTDMNLPGYANYGGKGISVCERWQSFPAFLEDMGECPSADMTIDRIDPAGNYEPGNCRWATKLQQARNTTANRVLEFDGRRMCVAEWADEIGIKSQAILNRLRYGWSIEKTLTYLRDARENNRVHRRAKP